jgi:hypothetical protein
MVPRAVTQAPALNPIELRLGGGMMALNRLITTFQSKRMPVAGLTVGRDGGGMRATLLLECPHETARQAGITAHVTKPGGTVVASGEPEKVEAWLGSLGDEVEDIVRLGPVARPGDGG